MTDVIDLHPRPTLETERIYLIVNETVGVVCQAFTDSVAAVRAQQKFQAVAPDTKFALASCTLVRGTP